MRRPSHCVRRIFCNRGKHHALVSSAGRNVHFLHDRFDGLHRRSLGSRKLLQKRRAIIVKLVRLLGLFFLLAAATQAQAPVAPLNAAGVATGCDNVTIVCTYTDVAVPAGPHFYFIVAANGTVANSSTPSNRVDVLVPAGVHNVQLKWNPSPTPGVTYFVFRGAPPTNLGITNSQ